MSSERSYVPVCLYTRFYGRSENVQVLLEELLLRAREVLIVIADDLHAYNKINTGRRREAAFAGARRLGDSYHRMFETACKHARAACIRVCRWRDLTSEDKFQEILRGIAAASVAVPEIRQAWSDFISYHVPKVGWRQSVSVHEWETRYLNEEVSMSIYATEILGYTTELWETLPPRGEPDPIRFLYARHAPLLEGLVGTTSLRRAHVALSEILPPGVLHRRF